MPYLDAPIWTRLESLRPEWDNGTPPGSDLQAETAVRSPSDAFCSTCCRGRRRDKRLWFREAEGLLIGAAVWIWPPPKQTHS